MRLSGAVAAFERVVLSAVRAPKFEEALTIARDHQAERCCKRRTAQPCELCDALNEVVDALADLRIAEANERRKAYALAAVEQARDEELPVREG